MFEYDPDSIESLRESRRQLATLLSNLPGMVYRTSLDPLWPLEFASDGALALTGYKPDELMNSRPNWASIVDPEDREMVWECVRSAVTSRRPFTLTYRITTASGHRRWVWEQGRGVFDADGEISSIEGFITDITERRSVEERLRRLNRLYAVLTQINEAIVRIRHPTSLLEEACRIAVETGRFRLAWVALRTSESNSSLKIAASHGDDSGLLGMILGGAGEMTIEGGHVARAISTGRHQIIQRIELDPRRKPWKELLLAHGMQSAAAFPLFVSDRVVGSFNLYSDKSPPFDEQEIRLLESMTGDLSFALERAEEESYRKTLQSDLARARSIETIGRVSGSVAHDFNNILMIIGTSAEALQRRADDLEIDAKELDKIQKACERGSDLTRRLLSFGRKSSTKPRRLDLGALVRNAEGLLARMLGSNVTLSVSIGDGQHPVISDPAQLEQVLLNFVLNAKDAMPEGGNVKLIVDEVETTHPMGAHGSIRGPYVRLIVEDTGHGLSNEVREQMFDPFFTTKCSQTGSGLGLSIAFDVARRSNGWISSDNAHEGTGARFEMYLPRADV